MAKCEHGRNDDTCTLCGKATVLDRVIAFLDSQPHYTSTGVYRREDLIYGVRAILCSSQERQSAPGVADALIELRLAMSTPCTTAERSPLLSKAIHRAIEHLTGEPTSPGSA
jgi:hypothetical protein